MAAADQTTIIDRRAGPRGTGPAKTTDGIRDGMPSSFHVVIDVKTTGLIVKSSPTGERGAFVLQPEGSATTCSATCPQRAKT
jgi:hypothetical protein